MKIRLYLLPILLLFQVTISAQEKYMLDSLEMHLVTSSTNEKLDILLQLSKINWGISPQQGISYADSAFNLAEELDNFRLKAKASIYGGVNFYYIGSYDKAIEYFHTALKIADQNNYQEIRAFAFNNIGMVYSKLNDLENAKLNYQQAANIMKELNNEIEYAKIVDNIAKIHVEKGNFEEALKSYKSIIEIIKRERNDKFLLWVLSDIGKIYCKTENLYAAKDYYLQALQLSEKINDNVGKSKVLNCLGELSLKNQKFDSSLFYFNEALNLAKNAGANDYIKKAYKNLSQYYSDIHNYKESLEYYKLYKTVSDTIHNTDVEQIIRDIQTKYEIDRKEKENALLSKDNKIQQLEIKKQTAINFYLILLIIIVFLFVLFILKQLKEKREAYRILTEKNNLISDQKNELEIQSEQLAESNATKEKLFSIIAHDLKSPFTSILGYTELLTSDYEEFSESERKKIIVVIEEAARGTLKLLENLLNWTMSQQNTITLKKEKYKLLDAFDDCIKTCSLTAKQKGVELIMDIPQNLTLVFDQQTMSRVFYNLINNSIKFTPANGFIKVTSKQFDDYTEIAIEDNGVGMDADTIARLFLVNNSKIKKGTNNESGTGLGLLICKDFIHKNGGEIYVESEVGKGSVFRITLPNG